MKDGKSGVSPNLIEIMPITKSAGHDPLSYFSSAKTPSGALVKAPLRSGAVTAVVLGSQSVASAKSHIRRAAFSLKKIRKGDVLDATLAPEFMRAARVTASYYAASLGALLSLLLPKMVIDEPQLYLNVKKKKKKAPQQSQRETILLQMETEERYGQYRAQVRQAFARGNSVIFVLPTLLEVLRAKEELSGGISDFVYHFGLDNKRHAKRSWVAAINDPHPILFITTPAGLAFLRDDVDTIIIERENSRAYRTLARPYINFKIFIENLAKEKEWQLVLGDSVLSIETLWREKNGEFGESSLIRWRLPAVQTALVDGRSKQEKDGHFEIISVELKAFIEKALIEKEKIFLFGARKGLYPTTVCGDCGSVLSCLNCEAPVVLHKRGGENIYVCHSCRSLRESRTLCDYCKSWKLVPLGIGIEEIARTIKALFPRTQVLILDKDHASTDNKARSIVKKFDTLGGILVGTELAFFHLEKVPYAALVSADSLFSIPDFGINERIFYLISHLREMSEKETFIQTRNIGKQILAWGTQGNIIDFYLNEIAERQELLYPPFSIFIKIICPPKNAERETKRLKEEFKNWQADIIKDSIVIRLLRASWPDQELSKKLSLLGPQFLIKVDPESIL